LITSRLDGSAQYTIKKEKIELNQWLSELIFKSFKPSDQELIKLNPREEVYGTIDKLLFPSALINVIENAIKYSSRQAIEIQIESSKNTLEILISDRGTGIPDTEKKAIFERFYRIGNEETRKTQGTGLGLYISNEILRLHGGEIVVVDRSGGGSVFKLILPS
jgi:signal transduction histidine kinase